MTDTLQDWMTVGYRLQSQEEIDALPSGSEIEAAHDSSEWYRRVDDEWYHLNDLDNDPQEDFAGDGYNRIRYLPTPAGVETARQYAWRYRCHVLNACAEYGYSADVALNAVADVGFTDDDFPLGVGLEISCSHDHARVRDGSVVHVGNPDDFAGYGVFVKRNGQYFHILGGNRYMGGRVTIDSVGGEEIRQPWIDERGGPGSVTEVLSVKAKAYVVGRKIATSYGWCETYDNIVADVGVVRDAARLHQANGVAVGVTLSPRAVRELPVGTVLRWRHQVSPETRVVWFVRAEDSANTAGTRRVFGYRDDHPNRLGHQADAMEVVSVPQPAGAFDAGVWNEIDVALSNTRGVDVWALLPPGTRLVYYNSHYAKAADGRLAMWPARRAVPGTGTYSIDQFNLDHMFVTEFPTTA